MLDISVELRSSSDLAFTLLTENFDLILSNQVRFDDENFEPIFPICNNSPLCLCNSEQASVIECLNFLGSSLCGDVSYTLALRDLETAARLKAASDDGLSGGLIFAIFLGVCVLNIFILFSIFHLRKRIRAKGAKERSKDLLKTPTNYNNHSEFANLDPSYDKTSNLRFRAEEKKARKDLKENRFVNVKNPRSSENSKSSKLSKEMIDKREKYQTSMSKSSKLSDFAEKLSNYTLSQEFTKSMKGSVEPYELDDVISFKTSFSASQVNDKNSKKFSKLTHKYRKNTSFVTDKIFQKDLQTLLLRKSKSIIHDILLILNKEIDSKVRKKINKKQDGFSSQISLGEGEEIPQLSLDKYLHRLVRGLNVWYHSEEMKVDPSKIIETSGVKCLLLALIYIQKLRKLDKHFVLTQFNVYKLFAVVLLVSGKFIEDEPIANSYWARVCGLSVEDVGLLETEFCFKIGFDFNITDLDFRDVIEEYGLGAPDIF